MKCHLMKKNSTLSPPRSWSSWMESIPASKEAVVKDQPQDEEPQPTSKAAVVNNETQDDMCTCNVNIFSKILNSSFETQTPTATHTSATATNTTMQQQAFETQTPKATHTSATATPTTMPQQAVSSARWRLLDKTPEMEESSDDNFTQDEQSTMTAVMSKQPTSPKPKKKSSKPKQKNKPKASTTKVCKSKHVKSPSKSSIKKRTTSAAYHTAYKAALQNNGGDVVNAKEAAREAYKTAAAEFEG